MAAPPSETITAATALHHYAGLNSFVALALLAGLLGVTLPPLTKQVSFLRTHRKAGGSWQMPTLMAVGLLVLLIGPLSWLSALAP